MNLLDAKLVKAYLRLHKPGAGGRSLGSQIDRIEYQRRRLHGKRYFGELVRDNRHIGEELRPLLRFNREQIERLHQMDRSLLRCAISEVLHSATPARVAIAEWVELARTYSGEPMRRLMNGVLGRIASTVGR